MQHRGYVRPTRSASLDRIDVAAFDGPGLLRLRASRISPTSDLAVCSPSRCARWEASTVPALTTPRALLVIGLAFGLLAAPAPAAAAAPPTMVTVIVRLQAGGDVDAQLRRATEQGAREKYRYRTALQGFAVEVPTRLVESLRRLPQVVAVELDTPVHTTDTQSPAEWGLDRIDQRALPLSNSYTYPSAGAGVTAYVLDTGILAGHNDFGGRVRSGYTAIGDGRGTADCHGHGTHVAGILAGSSSGVAKSAGLVPVRVLDCDGSGSTSEVVAGLDWVAADHADGAPAVANLSLGGPANSILDAAVRAVIADGVTVSVAAGNQDTSACDPSPARVREALTVAASTRGDARASYSNYGDCVDLFAPGDGIRSDGNADNAATRVMSGTSMAAPHVAGAAAVMLSQLGNRAPAAIADGLLGAATTGVITDAGSGSPNRLLDVASGGDAPPGPPACSGAGQRLVNPGFEAGTQGWTASGSGVIGQVGGAAHGGAWNARLAGKGVRATTTLVQAVAVPAGCTTYRLSFWLRIDSAETSSTRRDDTMTVTLGSTRLAKYSNVDKRASYVERAFDISRQAGRTVKLTFSASEDRSQPTTFAVDDVALTAG
jgi:subtilisin family serine protease